MSTPSRQPSYPARPAERDDLSAPATQIVRDRDAYLGQNREVGRRLTEDQYELFVTGEPAQALQREFERLSPQYIALHDIGTSSSLRLLGSMAASTASRVLRLSVRRQGHGVALATLQFVEISSPDGATLRVYSTDIDADTQARHQMARMLLAHSRLAVLVVGELPAHALRAALQPLIDSIAHERWPNREALLVPLGSSTALQPYATAFASHGIQAQVTPKAARATDAWSFIGGAWNRLHGVGAEGAATTAPSAVASSAAATVAAGPALQQPAAAAAPSLASSGSDDSELPTQPMGLRHAKPPAEREAVNWFEYAQRCASIKGMISCCVFDRTTGNPLAHAGGRPPAELLQTLGERLLVTASEVGAILGTGAEVQEAQISYPGHHVLLRQLPRHRGVILHAVLDAVTGNLALARAQLQRLDPQG